MSVERLKYLFHQFVNKTGTEQETREFLSMLRQSSYNDEVQALLDEIWDEPSVASTLTIEKAEKMFSRIVAQADDEKIDTRTILFRPWMKIAAAVLIVFGLTFVFYKTRTLAPSGNEIVKQDTKQRQPLRRFVNLPDGSSVILNENSKIDYGSTFMSNGKREVFLTGEAYFDIKHNESLPFIVHTGELQVTVLGTAFNVNASPENEVVTVTVTRGKVRVGDSKHEYSVVPNQQIVYNKAQSQLILKQVKAEAIVEWKNEDLYFDDVSMNDVANQLQERFHVTLSFSTDAIKNCRFSATFLKSQSLEQILNVIAEFNNVTYKFQTKTSLLLEGEGCSNERMVQ